MKLTEKQIAKIDKIKIDRLTKIMNGGTFGLSNSACSNYLGMINDTFHKPCCHILELDDDRAYIEAVFFGSGIASHPVKRGWIPVSVIEVSFPTFYYYCCRIKNYFTKSQQ